MLQPLLTSQVSFNSQTVREPRARISSEDKVSCAIYFQAAVRGWKEQYISSGLQPYTHNHQIIHFRCLFPRRRNSRSDIYSTFVVSHPLGYSITGCHNTTSLSSVLPHEIKILPRKITLHFPGKIYGVINLTPLTYFI